MADKLIVYDNGRPLAEFALLTQRVRLGRDAACELHVPHSELPAVAATIDYRGGSYLVQNHCPYVVYLEQQAIAEGAWSMWNVGQRLQVSQNVAVMLLTEADALRATQRLASRSTDGSPASAPGDTGGTGADQRKLIQLAVIGICVVAAPVLLLLDPPQSAPQGQQEIVQWDVLLSELQDSDKPYVEYFQQAYQADVQSSSGAAPRERAIAAYRYLLQLEPIRSAPADIATAEGKVKLFVAQRLASLQARGRGPSGFGKSAP